MSAGSVYELRPDLFRPQGLREDSIPILHEGELAGWHQHPLTEAGQPNLDVSEYFDPEGNPEGGRVNGLQQPDIDPYAALPLGGAAGKFTITILRFAGKKTVEKAATSEVSAGAAGLTGSLRITISREHPPIYRHTITKGGLDDIMTHQRMKYSEARHVAGGGEAVRAYVGPVDRATLTEGSVVIEFTTKQPAHRRLFGENGVSSGHPARKTTCPINLLKVYFGNRTVRIFFPGE